VLRAARTGRSAVPSGAQSNRLPRGCVTARGVDSLILSYA